MQNEQENKKKVLPEETIQSLVRLGAVLRKITSRLLTEGKIMIVNGKIIFKEHVEH